MKFWTFTVVLLVWLGMVGTIAAAPKGEYLHPDHIGRTVMVTNDAETILWEVNYKPFGEVEVLYDPNNWGPSFGFPGQYYDEESGLYYNYFRSYDPTLGRYIQSDPIGLNGGLNTYGYVGGNPIDSADPTGLICGTGACVAIAYGAFKLGMFAYDAYDAYGTITDECASSLDKSLAVANVAINLVPGASTAKVLSKAGDAAKYGSQIAKNTSRIKESSKLVREAAAAGKSHQAGIDKLTARLQAGDLNPGLGSKSLGSGISYARGRDGARVFFRQNGNGVEILGKANKANESAVIKEVLRVFGK